MSGQNPSGRITVANRQLDGISSDVGMPTYILNTLDLAADELESEIERVGYLQTLAPIFRVVLLTDRPVFSLVRKYQWPVEHIVPQVHQLRLSHPDRTRRYIGQRIRIAESHYRLARTLTARASSSLAGLIGDLLDLPELVKIVDGLAIPVKGQPNAYNDPRLAFAALRSTPHVEFSTAEGTALITCEGPLRSFVLVDAQASGQSHGDHSTPDWVSKIVVEVDAESSVSFEAYLYSAIAQHIGSDLTVVVPHRAEAVRGADVLHWVDLCLCGDKNRLVVRPEYLTAYQVLAGSSEFEWHAARDYALIRRVSRAASKSKSVAR
ncbi:hypothetical protein [Brevibacterium antiquum]|uniref:hypothetical protein n=1 Tax=Brevibacterium antiquum TaxID=234835 RepID=UPI0011AEE75C|nr:hypothetical protein [Brevibacterium antiquum]